MSRLQELRLKGGFGVSKTAPPKKQTSFHLRHDTVFETIIPKYQWYGRCQWSGEMAIIAVAVAVAAHLDFLCLCGFA